MFDEDANEIIEISNINISMPYRQYGYPADQIPPVSRIEKLMLFAYTGPLVVGQYSGGGATESLKTKDFFRKI